MLKASSAGDQSSKGQGHGVPTQCPTHTAICVQNHCVCEDVPRVGFQQAGDRRQMEQEWVVRVFKGQEGVGRVEGELREEPY